MKVVCIHAEWVRRNRYGDGFAVETKVAENRHGEFFENVILNWLDAGPGDNRRFAVAYSDKLGRWFAFPVSSVIAGIGLPKGIELEVVTGDVVAIAGRGRFRVGRGPHLSHGFVLVPEEE